MNDKYVLTEEFIEVDDKKLYRIKAIKDFGGVSSGQLGGFVEKEENLSAYDDAWVFDNASVYDDARVYGNARVFAGEIKNRQQIIVFQNIGSRCDNLTMIYSKQSIYCKVGCFADTIDKFEQAVKITHQDTDYAEEYALCIKIAKIRFARLEEKEN